MPLMKRVILLLNIAGHYLQSFFTGTIDSMMAWNLGAVTYAWKAINSSKVRDHAPQHQSVPSGTVHPATMLQIKESTNARAQVPVISVEVKHPCSIWSWKQWFLADNFSQTIILDPALHQPLQHSYWGFILPIKMFKVAQYWVLWRQEAARLRLSQTGTQSHLLWNQSFFSCHLLYLVSSFQQGEGCSCLQPPAAFTTRARCYPSAGALGTQVMILKAVACNGASECLHCEADTRGGKLSQANWLLASAFLITPSTFSNSWNKMLRNRTSTATSLGAENCWKTAIASELHRVLHMLLF